MIDEISEQMIYAFSSPLLKQDERSVLLFPQKDGSSIVSIIRSEDNAPIVVLTWQDFYAVFDELKKHRQS